MSRLVRRDAGRPGSLLLAAAGCAAALAGAGCGRSTAASGAAGPAPTTSAAARDPATTGAAPERSAPALRRAGSTFTLMQMNLCLSGMAGCYALVAYPAVLGEAVARIRENRPDAVTLSETCRGDVARIARRTGYHLRFSIVPYDDRRLPCVRPGGRGLFGDAVLTRAAVVRTDNRDFAGQSGPERRRWICVGTRAGVDVCTAHLNTRSAVEAEGNESQCAELASLLARRAAARPVIFGGDVNRRASCAPDGLWTRTDRAGHHSPGLQHVYGGGGLRSPVVEVVPAVHTDHDVLLVRARLRPR